MPVALRFGVLAFAFIGLGWGCSSRESESAAPVGDWPTAPPETQGFDSAALAGVIERIDEEDLPIDSLLVVRNGVLILDAYFYPYLGEQPHDVASVTKSVTSTLVGIAIDQKLLSLDQGVVASFPDLAPVPPQDSKADIELRHLLTMTSGLDCGRTPGEPELNEMLASDHYVKYAIEIPMAVQPDTEFAYCSPGVHLLSAMIAKATGASALEFANENLFGPLGIHETSWPEDPQGVTHGWGDLQLHPHDMARIGQLFLNKGGWNGVRVVAKDWIEAATQAWNPVDFDGNGYGYLWWILGGAFEGLYEAQGNGGQAIVAWPGRDLVLVFTGRGADVRAEVAPALAAALKSDAPLDPNPDGYARLNAAIREATKPPEAKPVPALPRIAAEVSGRVYRMEPNLLDVKCITLRFDLESSAASEAQFELTLGGAGSGFYQLLVGMDGVPRFSDDWQSGIPVGIVGEWTGAERNVFSMHFDEVAGSKHFRILGDFDQDALGVDLEITDAVGAFPPQTVRGSSVANCN